MIKLTQVAAKQVQAAAEQGAMQGMALRIAVKTDDTGAFEYGFGFDQATEEDMQFTSEGIDIVVSPAYADLVRDLVIDYVEIEPGKHHFIFLNPNDPNYVPPKDMEN